MSHFILISIIMKNIVAFLSRFPVKINLLYCFWINIQCLLFAQVYCYHRIIVLEIISKQPALSSLWPVASFWMLSYVLKLFFTGWSKNFCPSIITLGSSISTVERKYSVRTVLLVIYSNNKTKSQFAPWKIGWIK